MKIAPPHPAEQLRLQTLHDYELLDTEIDQRFQQIVEQASAIAGVPISLVSLVDKERQWFKARFGIDAEETSRDVAFCAHAILVDDLFIVPDARKDDRFADNPLVAGAPHVIFYAGAQLRARNGMPLGTLCVIDHEPHDLDDAQRDALRMLAKQAQVLLEARQRGRLAARNRAAAAEAPMREPSSAPSSSQEPPPLRRAPSA